MELIDILGYIGAVCIGLVLGLIGGGGSILTVPVLVYLLGVDRVLATGYSLFIVGISAVFGAYAYWRRKLVDVTMAAVFGIPSMFGVYISRKYVLPNVPDELFHISGFVFTKGVAIMVLFAVLMLGASYFMIRGRKDEPEIVTEKRSIQQHITIGIQGLAIGLLTGLLGAGGGFLIVSALVVLTKMPMKLAIGTSLTVIAIKSLFGFLGEIQEAVIDWHFLLIFTGLAVVGILVGNYLSRFISGQKLKPAFGWFVLVMGIYVLIKELIL